MAEHDRESRAGLFSGLLAGVLVLALTAMSFAALGPQNLNVAEFSFPIDLPGGAIDG